VDGRVRRVAVVEESAAQQRDPHRAEIPRARDAELGATGARRILREHGYPREIDLFVRARELEERAVGIARTLQGEGVHPADVDHAWNGAKARHQLVVKAPLPRRVGVRLRPWRGEVEHNGARRPVSGVDRE
jgi:hypothetical protein